MNGNKNLLTNYFLKDPVPFSEKRDVNWTRVRNVAAGLIGLGIVILLTLPGKSPESEFSESENQADERPMQTSLTDASFPEIRTRQNYSYQPVSRSGGEPKAGMIVAREGVDAAVSLQPGAKIRLRLIESVIVGNQSVPIVAVVSEDFSTESGIAIPRDSKMFGDASFDKDSGRALVSWKAIQFPGGRIRQIEALAAALNGHPGLEGVVHSEALKNAVGHTMTRFVGAYAEGSMERSILGNKGGHENGMKNAIAETAKEQADRYADSLKKERVWIELKASSEFYALLTQSFRFLDPGGAYR